ncbi:MAG: hypothetical protein LBU51_00075, partial [Bacteroidales bacterium]|nr:hypothetical protein [Bacteroidales bacterium]
MKVPLFTFIKRLFAALKRHWTTKFRLVIKNDDTHKENFSFRLTPRNIFVVLICSTLILIMVTSLLIAFTPLRYYIPGYTN